MSERESTMDRVQDSQTPKGRSLWWWTSQLIPPGLVLIAGVGVIVILGIAQRQGWISAGGTPASNATSETEIYTCPMHPNIRQPGPGKCPICAMPLVPATSAARDNLDELSISVEPAQRRLANIQTAEAKRETIVTSIQTIGAIAIDESRMATIASYVDGRIERLFADYTGVEVSKDDHLAVVYSPELYSAQVEYIESRNSSVNAASTLPAVREAQQKLAINSRQRLIELGLLDEQIKELEASGTAKSRLTIFSPIGGTVVEKLAMEGKYVKAGEPIYRIADLSMVWLMLELFPEDAGRIRYGQRVDAGLASLPGETFKGRVAFIAPTVDSKKRSVGVRVEFRNEQGRLRPGDYANAKIYLPIGELGEVYDAGLAGKWISPMHPQIILDAPGECPICGMDLVPTSRYGYSDTPVKQPESLYVPRSALLMAGNHSVVYVEEEPGRFEIRSVKIGPILRDKVIILDGVKAGEQVATSGNFLIDSQMQLAGKPSLIDPTRAIAAQEIRNEPMELPDQPLNKVEGRTGEDLESLFTKYVAIQKSLAADQKPVEADAIELHRLANVLSTNEEFSTEAREETSVIARHSEHIHHLPIEKARLEAFRPISHAILNLASLVRGEEATNSFQHMFCPMVKGGAGDWLQIDTALINPYWGSEMLSCGERVRELSPTETKSDPPTEEPPETSPPVPSNEQEDSQ